MAQEETEESIQGTRKFLEESLAQWFSKAPLMKRLRFVRKYAAHLRNIGCPKAAQAAEELADELE